MSMARRKTKQFCEHIILNYFVLFPTKRIHLPFPRGDDTKFFPVTTSTDTSFLQVSNLTTVSIVGNVQFSPSVPDVAHPATVTYDLREQSSTPFTTHTECNGAAWTGKLQ